MRKVIIVLLLVFIVLIFSFVSVRYFANAPDTDNWFNNEYRDKFAEYPFLRTVFGLRWDGDAKADYLLGARYKKLVIEVDRYEDCQLTEESLDTVTRELEKVLKKPEGIEFQPSNILDLTQTSYSRSEIRDIADNFQYYKKQKGEAHLYLLCLNSSTEDPTYIGLTAYENGVVIFWQSIMDLTEDNPATLDAYLSSTILHEIGHQLGLDHVDDANCIMAASVESPGNAAGAISEIPQEFCEEELQAIEQIRQKL